MATDGHWWMDVYGQMSVDEKDQNERQMEWQNETNNDCDGLHQQWRYKAICICELYNNGMQKRKEIFFLLLCVFVFFLFFFFSFNSKVTTKAIHYVIASSKTHKNA
jgi:hypothetical protein